MPIYEYWCDACAKQVEILVRGSTVPVCPSCKGEGLERILSLPRVHSPGTRALALKAAKGRDRKQAEERLQEQARYERSHEGH